MTSLETNQNRAFYKKLFSEDKNWSTPYPNSDEAARWAKIVKLLSAIAAGKRAELNAPVRILDVGCGRGWLTHSASIFGQAEGVDPVPESIQTARRMYPQLKFHVGTAKDVSQSEGFAPYDIVIASEVIEHVVDQAGFVAEITACLARNGYLIVTTPRGELLDKWIRAGFELQPIECWVTEKEVDRLFGGYGFKPFYQDRIYIDSPRLSILHRFCASRKVGNILRRLRLIWVQQGVRYLAALYQIWCFQNTGQSRPMHPNSE